MGKFDIGHGFFGTFCSFLLGILPEFTQMDQLVIVFWFQIVAFTVTSLVGIMTLVHIHTKLVDRKRRLREAKKENNENKGVSHGKS